MDQRACEAVGIDLGTTYSSLAYMGQRLMPLMVNDSCGQAVVSSAIYFDDAGVVVGEEALQQSKAFPDRVVQFVKVHMGDEWHWDYGGQRYTPEMLSAIILRHLIREAEPQIGPVRKAVITVPAYFTEKRRLATQQAGEIAGLEVIGTLNEPMAATLAYGLHTQQQEHKVVVYDLGGGTFDVTVVRITPTTIEELATRGNRQLGGRDWDQCLIELVAEDFARAQGADLRTDHHALQTLRVECEQAKRRLSKMMSTPIRFHACGQEHVTTVTREQFEARTAGLLYSTRITVELALEDAGLRWPEVSRIILVGGSTHMPAVRQVLREMSGLTPETEVNPVVAVALGAAIYAHILETRSSSKELRVLEKTEATTEAPVRPEAVSSAAEPESVPLPPPVAETSQAGRAEPSSTQPGPDERPTAVTAASATIPEIRFVTAHGVGVKARVGEEWRNSVLIPKNTRVPAEARKRYYTSRQTREGASLRVEITQGDVPEVELAETLGEGKITGLPADEPPGQPVDVIMEFDAAGRLHTRAVYVNTGQQMNMTVSIPGGLRPEDVSHQRRRLEQIPFLSLFNPDGESATETGWQLGEDGH